MHQVSTYSQKLKQKETDNTLEYTSLMFWNLSLMIIDKIILWNQLGEGLGGEINFTMKPKQTSQDRSVFQLLEHDEM